MGRAFAPAMLCYRSFIWNDQTSLANASPDERKDAVTGTIELIRGSLGGPGANNHCVPGKANFIAIHEWFIGCTNHTEDFLLFVFVQ